MKIVMSLPKKEVWLKEADRHRCVGGLRELPYVEDKYECVLKENNVPYRKFEQLIDIAGIAIPKKFCEYWNPIFFEKEMVTLPSYIHMADSSYRYYGKEFSSKAPTYATARLAKRIQKFVERKIVEYEACKENTRKENFYNIAKTLLAGNATVFCKSPELFDSEFDDLEVNGGWIKILRTQRRGENYVAIFNMKRVNLLNERGKGIKLRVPNHMVGFLIGKNHRNIHLWENALAVEKIQVYSI